MLQKFPNSITLTHEISCKSLTMIDIVFAFVMTMNLIPRSGIPNPPNNIEKKRKRGFLP